MSNSKKLIDFLNENNLITENGGIRDNIPDDVKIALEISGLSSELTQLKEKGYDNYVKGLEGEEKEYFEKTYESTKLSDENSNIDFVTYYIENDLISNGEFRTDISDEQKEELKNQGLIYEYNKLEELGTKEYFDDQLGHKNFAEITNDLVDHANLKEFRLDELPAPKMTNDEYQKLMDEVLDENGQAKVFADNPLKNTHLPEDFSVEEKKEENDSEELNAEEIVKEAENPLSYEELHEYAAEAAENITLLEGAYLTDNKDELNDKLLERRQENFDDLKANAYAGAELYEKYKNEILSKYEEGERPSYEELSKEINEKISKTSDEVKGEILKPIYQKLSSGKESEIKIRPTGEHLSAAINYQRKAVEARNKYNGIKVVGKLAKRLDAFDKKLEKRFGKAYSISKTLASVAGGIAAASNPVTVIPYTGFMMGKAIKDLRKKYREEKEAGNIKKDTSCLKWAFSFKKGGGWKETLNVAGSGMSVLGGPLLALGPKMPKIAEALKFASKSAIDKVIETSKPLTVKKVAKIVGVGAAVALLACSDNAQDAVVEVVKAAAETEAATAVADTAKAISNSEVAQMGLNAIQNASDSIHNATDTLMQTDTMQFVNNNVRVLADTNAAVTSAAMETVSDTLKHLGLVDSTNVNVNLDSAKVKTDSVKLDSVKVDSANMQTLKTDTLNTQLDSTRVDSVKMDSVKLDSVKTDTLNNQLDSVKTDSVKVDSLNTEVDSSAVDNQVIEQDVETETAVEKEVVTDAVKEPEVMSEKVNSQADKFIGKDLTDKLEARFDNGDFEKFGLTKDEFFHKSAMIKAYLPVSDSQYGDLLEQMAAGNELSAENAKYVSEMLTDIEKYQQYGKLFGDTEQAQSLFNDVMNNHDSFVQDGQLSRREVFDNLAKLKMEDPAKFQGYLDKYEAGDFKDIVEVEADNTQVKASGLLNSSQEGYSDKVSERLEQSLYNNQSPNNLPLTQDPKTGEMKFDAKKLSPKAFEAYQEEFYNRFRELDTTAATPEVAAIQAAEINAQMQKEALEAFSAENKAEHLKTYQAQVAAAQIPDAVIPDAQFPKGDVKDLNPKINGDGVTQTQSTQVTKDGTKIETKTTEIDNKNVKSTTHEKTVTKETNGVKETVTQKSSSGVINGFEFSEANSDHRAKLQSLREAFSKNMSIGNSIANHQASADIVGNTNNSFADEMKTLAERQKFEIKVDGQGYGQYELKNGKTVTHFVPQYMTEEDKAIYEKMIEQNTDKKGNIDKFGAKFDFLQEKMNGSEAEKTLSSGKETLADRNTTTQNKSGNVEEASEKPTNRVRRKGPLGWFGFTKEATEVEMPKAGVDANGNPTQPESRFKSGENNINEQKTSVSEKRAQVEELKNGSKTPVVEVNEPESVLNHDLPKLDASSENYDNQSLKRFANSMNENPNMVGSGITKDGKVDVFKMTDNEQKIYLSERYARQQELGLSNGDEGMKELEAKLNKDYVKSSAYITQQRAAQMANTK